jgi:predicted metal-dependent HD superfamily phosphohydrolase
MDGSIGMKLGERWHQLARMASLVDAESLGIELLGRWQEPHRRYRTMPRIWRRFLDALELLEAEPKLQLAAWFHDAIYSPQRHDNESRRARHWHACGCGTQDWRRMRANSSRTAVLATGDARHR